MKKETLKEDKKCRDCGKAILAGTMCVSVETPEQIGVHPLHRRFVKFECVDCATEFIRVLAKKMDEK